MFRGIYIALLVVGIIVVIYGITASESISSDVSRFFTGSPTDKAIWLLVGGSIASIVGLLGVIFGPRGGG